MYLVIIFVKDIIIVYWMRINVEIFEGSDQGLCMNNYYL